MDPMWNSSHYMGDERRKAERPEGDKAAKVRCVRDFMALEDNGCHVDGHRIYSLHLHRLILSNVEMESCWARALSKHYVG